MGTKIEAQLNDQIADFKNVAWNDTTEDLNAHLALTDFKLFDFCSPYRTSMELLKDNEPFFKITSLFRLDRPNTRYAFWHVMSSLSLQEGNMEMSGLEKSYTALDKEISQITGADVLQTVKGLIHQYGGK